MRFLALWRKELRESLPWMLLAGLLLLAVGVLVLRAKARFPVTTYWSYHEGLEPGQTVNNHYFLYESNLALPALWLAFIAPGLGLVLGVQHFWVPLYARTWSFLLHRSVTRSTVFWAKLAAAVAAFVVSVGLVWSGLYWYACRPGLFVIPEPTRMLLAGWLHLVMGLLVYLGTALSALSMARWYTTRIFGLAFAVLAVFVIWMQWQPPWIAGLIALAVVILLLQDLAEFRRREF